MSRRSEGRSTREGAKKKDPRSMPAMRKYPLGYTVGDLHFTLKAPVCRAEKDSWLEVQRKYIKKLRKIVGDLPLFVTGDVFNSWNVPPELINFLIAEFPNAYAIPGNHDLPYHDYAQLNRSAFWTLVQAGVLKGLKPGQTLDLGGDGEVNFNVTGFPWGIPVSKPTHLSKTGVNLAVIHDYCWIADRCYKDPPNSKHVDNWGRKLRDLGYNCAVFGDNHKGFLHRGRKGLPQILNGGTFMRRHADEKDYEPMVGVIYSDGSLGIRALDVSKDRFVKNVEELFGRSTTSPGAEEFVESVQNLEQACIDFEEAVRRELLRGEKIDRGVRKAVNDILEHVKK